MRVARRVRRAAWGNGPRAISAPRPRPTQPTRRGRVTVPAQSRRQHTLDRRYRRYRRGRRDSRIGRAGAGRHRRHHYQGPRPCQTGRRVRLLRCAGPERDARDGDHRPERAGDRGAAATEGIDRLPARSRHNLNVRRRTLEIACKHEHGAIVRRCIWEDLARGHAPDGPPQVVSRLRYPSLVGCAGSPARRDCRPSLHRVLTHRGAPQPENPTIAQAHPLATPRTKCASTALPSSSLRGGRYTS